MNTHIMIDIETLALDDNAVVTSFGAVAFNKKGFIEPTETAEIYRELPIQAQLNAGRIIEAKTLNWYQSKKLEIPPACFNLEYWRLGDHLKDLHHFIVEFFEEEQPALYIWSHGVCFDITKLQNLFKQYYDYVPWEYWQIMDCRTLVNLWPQAKLTASEDASHNALEDARDQVKWLLALNKELNFL